MLVAVAHIYAVGLAGLADRHGWVKDKYPAVSKDLGLAWSVSLPMLMTFFMAQVSVHVLCTLQVCAFFCIAVIGVTALLFVFLFLPETEGVEEDTIADSVEPALLLAEVHAR